MIYLFYGTDQEKTRAKWRRVISSFQIKHPEGQIFYFAPDRFDPSRWSELALSAEDLFGAKRLVVADRLLEDESVLDFFVSNLEDLVKSPVVFALLESEIKSDLLKKIEKAGGQIEKFNRLTAAKADSGFNIFALADALAARDRRRLWVLSQQALRAGHSAEDIFWKLVWQVKTLLLVKRSSAGSLKTVKPYTATKAARSLKNFQPGELEQYSWDLLVLWHEARRGLIDFEIGLERFILKI